MVNSLYLRVRLILCAAWGITPPELDARIAQHEIAAEDVIEAVFLHMSTHAFAAEAIQAYLFREDTQKKEDKVAQMQKLVVLMKKYAAENNTEMMEKIKAEMNRLQGDTNG